MDPKDKFKSRGFAGNKSFLPSKPCQACARPMTWRKSWEKNWAQLKYCSQACSRAQGPKPIGDPK